MKQHTYIAIDLKSFYASVECRERGLDPLDTNLVVADESRTDKTICLAVTPSLKSYGISGRGRLFEVKQRVKEANAGRQHDATGHRLDGTSHFFSELQVNPVSYTHLRQKMFLPRIKHPATIRSSMKRIGIRWPYAEMCIRDRLKGRLSHHCYRMWC